MYSKILTAGALSALLFACGHEDKPANTSASVKTTTTTTTSANPTNAGSTTRPVNVSDEIKDICHIETVSKESPKFDFDSTDLSDDDRTLLSQVAACFTTGPLKGKGIHLTGRADPRGEDEYNMSLGASRASSVRSYLTNLGVETARIQLSSRGKLDATGTDEEGYRRDRRVDVEVKK